MHRARVDRGGALPLLWLVLMGLMLVWLVPMGLALMCR
jgi:hypothetical protein